VREGHTFIGCYVDDLMLMGHCEEVDGVVGELTTTFPSLYRGAPSTT
jgi:hypothetical protein